VDVVDEVDRVDVLSPSGRANLALAGRVGVCCQLLQGATCGFPRRLRRLGPPRPLRLLVSAYLAQGQQLIQCLPREPIHSCTNQHLLEESRKSLTKRA
jgi:hypothetical protein